MNFYTPKTASASTWRIEMNLAVSLHHPADSGLPFSLPPASHPDAPRGDARLTVVPFAALPESRVLPSNVAFKLAIAT